MELRRLGRSGLQVSPLCLGTMMFGGPTDEKESVAIIDAARDGGCNFIDTADVYNDGKSEEIVGRAIARDRDRWILATKVANAMSYDNKPNRRGLSRKWIIEACNASLKRLGTDYVDLYYMHKEDHATPLEESVRAMGDLQRAGKIRYFAVSNHRSWRVAEMCNIADGLGIDRPACSQPYYNAFNRMPEVEHLPACNYYGLGAVPYSPLARGVLSGKYAPNTAPGADTRASRKDARMMQTEWRHESLELAQKVKSHAEKKGTTAVAFAIAWVLNNQFVTSAIAGPRTLDQWRTYIPALSYRLDAEDEALVDSLVSTGHPSTPGYNDPAYPIEGRVPRQR
ncbi:MAG: aldo/keto reductase [Alphaproteobacteria bacterium]|nr:aldo/keto reductase [Alphaproteobacteria bacterium]